MLASGGVRCWGSDINGIGSVSTPVTALSSGVDAIAVGRGGATVLVGGAVQLLDFPGSVRPDLGLGSGTVAVAGSVEFDDHVCVLSAAGEVRCHGRADPALGAGPDPASPGIPGCVLGFGDEDGDRLCEAIDACSAGVQGGVGRPSPRLVLSSVYQDDTPGNERLTFRTRFPLPAGVAFGDLDPLGGGSRLVLVDPSGVIADIGFSAGAYAGRGTAGWRASGSGRKWNFVDATGANGKVVARVALTDKGKGLPGGLVDLNVVRGPGTLTIDRNQILLQAVFVPGDAAAAASGLCSQTNLGGTCRFNSSFRTLTCKP